MTGRVKYLSEKGFGFIVPSDKSKDLFFHKSELKTCGFEDLSVGDSVTFETAEGDKGPKAVKICRP